MIVWVSFTDWFIGIDNIGFLQSPYKIIYMDNVIICMKQPNKVLNIAHVTVTFWIPFNTSRRGGTSDKRHDKNQSGSYPTEVTIEKFRYMYGRDFYGLNGLPVSCIGNITQT